MNARQELIEQNRMRQRMELRFEKRLLREFESIGKRASEVYESEAQLRRLLDSIEPALKPIFEAHYRTVLQEFSRRQAQVLNLPKEETRFDRMFRTFMEQVGAENVQQVSDTTIKRIRAAILEAFALELATEDIAKMIRESVGGSIGRYRSRLIARTETHTAASYANHQIALEADIPEMKKRWVSANDARTRPHHVEMNGVEVGLEEDFEVPYNGIPYRMSYPGDPRGGPGNVINCFTGDTPIAFHNIKSVIRSVYTGQLITIKTASGYKLTGTPNHPVLTADGFVPLGSIKNGDKLVSCPINENFADGLDIDHVPATFHQVYHAALKEGVRVGVGSAGVNLYGRIPDGDVDVIRTDGKLLDATEPSFFQALGKLIFKKSDLRAIRLFSNRLPYRRFFEKFTRFISHLFVRFADLFHPLFRRHLRPLEPLRFGLVADRNPSLFKGGSHSGPRYAQGFGDDVFARAVKVHPDRFIRDSLVFPSRQDIPGFNNLFVNESGRATKRLGNLSCRLSAHVHLDECIAIDIESTHNAPVFTIETKEGIYNAGGIIAKNCRCVVGYVIPEDFVP
jgi:hypothetical protein